MPAAARAYTPAEAAVLSEVAVKAVHNAIDKRIVQGRGGEAGAASPRMLTDADLLRLKLWYGVGAILSADRRQQLFDAIAAEPAAATVRADDFLIVDVAAARRRLADRIRWLRKAEAIVRSDPTVMGGEPVFAGTRIAVRTVASMLSQGATREEIADGYPSLTEIMIEAAAIWSAAHPARGRPRRVEDTLRTRSICARVRPSTRSIRKLGLPCCLR